MTTVPYDLTAAMLELGWKLGDVARVTGKCRQAVWRWRKSGACPDYVRTIVEQQKRIRMLAAALAA